jgi:hypothetical protein
LTDKNTNFVKKNNPVFLIDRPQLPLLNPKQTGKKGMTNPKPQRAQGKPKKKNWILNIGYKKLDTKINLVVIYIYIIFESNL